MIRRTAVQRSPTTDDLTIAYKYSLGGGYKTSDGWEPIGPANYYDTFGPELSFARTLRDEGLANVAIAKFTHSGSQIIDWTPEGSVAKSRKLYPAFIEFIKDSVKELEQRGYDVDLEGVLYHVGENDMSWGPFGKGAPERVLSVITQSRKDLELLTLTWYVSKQPLTDDESVNKIDVTSKLEQVIASTMNVVHFEARFACPGEKTCHRCG